MSDDIENWDALLVRLKHSLQALALPAEIQLDLFPDFVCKVEELALDFDHWRSCILCNDKGELNEEQESLLRQLDSALAGMSGEQKQNLWTVDALLNHPDWQGVRDMAKMALDSFGWGAEIPPDYKHEYVLGANI